MIRNPIARSRSARRRTQSARLHACIDFLEARRLLAAFVVNEAQDLPDANLNDGVALTSAGTVSLRAVAEHALQMAIENLEITFASALDIGATTANLSTFTVQLTATGVKFGTGLQLGVNSQVTGGEFNGGLSLGSGGTVSSAKVGGTGLSLAGSGKVQNSSLTAGVAGGSNTTVSGNTISGLVELGGNLQTVQNNTVNEGGVRINGTAGTPSNFNSISGNTLSGGTGILLTLVQDSVVTNNTVFGGALHGIRVENVTDADTGAGIPGRNAISANKVGMNGAGAAVGNAAGIVIRGSSNDTVGGATAALGNTVVSTQGNGIEIFAGSGYVVQNNLSGTNAAGAAGMGNAGDGIFVTATESQIGGAGAGNFTAGNGRRGITVNGNFNLIQANAVGTNAARSLKRPNLSDGMAVTGNFVTIGGSSALGLGNIISGNDGKGIVLLGSASVIQGNAIGSTATQTSLGNKLSGLTITGGRNTIGGAAAALGNVVTGNGANGMTLVGNESVFQGNVIGTDANGTNLGNLQYGIQIIGSRNEVGDRDGDALANTVAFNGTLLGARGHAIFIDSGNANSIQRNALYKNSGRGISLSIAGQTPNDAGVIVNRVVQSAPDADAGPNDLMNYPVALRREGSQVRWMLNSTPNQAFTIDLYRNTEADNSGYGEGRTHVASFQVVTDQFGHVEFLTNDEAFMAATATAANGSTSEFSMVDSDLDGLADAWETRGIDVNDDGAIDLTLPGANPLRKDVYFEVDAMQGLGPIAATVSGLPAGLATGTALDYVVKAFAAAPAALVNNPDGQNGINLHFQVDETNIARAGWTSRDADGWPTEFQSLVNARFGTAAERAGGNAANVKAARQRAFRYALFAQSLQGTSADAISNDIAGSELAILSKDFAGADGNLGTADDYPNLALAQAGVFMHELGHAFGLAHGGGGVNWLGEGDDVNNKPNYQSVMNRLWTTPFPDPSNAQEQAFRNSWRLDYSSRAFPNLDENALAEAAGIGGDAGNTLKLPIGTDRFVAETGPVDWNNNGVATETGVSLDINADGQKTVLAGREDWSQLRYYFAENRSAAGFRNPLFEDQIAPLDGPPPQPSIDLAVSQESSSQQPVVGQDLTYTIIARNNGPDTQASVVVTDTLPAGSTFVSADPDQGTFSVNNGVVTFNVGFLGSSQFATLRVTIKPAAAGEIRNTVAISPTANDPNTANNTNQADLTAAAPPDLSITQQASAAQVNINSQFTYTHTVTNNGSIAADAVKVVDILPAGLLVISAQTSQGTFSVNGATVEFQAGSLAPGASATFTIVARGSSAGPKANTAVVSAAIPDDTSNNSATTNVVILPKPVTAPKGKVSVLRVGSRREQVITLTFDGLLSAASVKKLSIYRLAAAGRDKKFGTRDDVVTGIKAATFDAKKKLLTIRTKSALNLSQPLQLKIKSGALKDTFGRSIDGDRNGTSGGDLIATVTRSGVSVKKK